MIQSFQKFSQSRFAKIFLGIVALSFMAFFGGGSWFRSRHPHEIIAEVGPVTISHHQFAEKVQQQVQRIMAQTKHSFNRDELLQSGLPQFVLSHLIQENLLNLEATHLGLTISDEALRNYIHSLKAFQNNKGEFDRALFTQMLRATALTEDAFISNLRKELVREQLIDAVTVGAYVPEDLTGLLFEAQYQRRQASMLFVSPQDIPAPPLPSQQELEKFYNEHKKEFALPELRTLTVLMVDPAVFTKNIHVTEEEIQSFYTAKAAELENKPLEDVKKRIIGEIQAQKASDQAYQLTQDLDEKIAGGATLEEISASTKDLTLTKLELIDAQGKNPLENPLPSLPADKEAIQQILQTGFGLENNMDSPFAQTSRGLYYMVRVDKISPATLPSFKEIQDRVGKLWTKLQQLKLAQQKAKAYGDAFNKGNRATTLMAKLPSLSLAEPSPTVPDTVKELVFTLRPHQAGVTFTPKGFAVVVLNTITPPTPEVRAEKFEAFQEALLRSYKEDLLMGYLNALRVRYPVKINSEAIKALFSGA